MSVASLLLMFVSRVLGLFLLFPVFALLAKNYPGYSPLLAGIALGAYGLTQSILQIPFGMLSDRYGRKKILLLGLVLFALGSFVGAAAQSMTQLLVARVLQGCGAVSSVILALVADSVSPKQRGSVMALFGMVIGLTFIVALSAGPQLAQWRGLSGIFLITAALTCICMCLLPTIKVLPAQSVTPAPIDASEEASVIAPSSNNTPFTVLATSCLSIFFAHLMLTVVFTRVPIVLNEVFSIAATEHSLIYLVILLASAPPVFALVRKQAILVYYREIIFVAAVLLIFIFPALLFGTPTLTLFLVLLYLFFVIFSVLEGMLPNLVSVRIPLSKRGFALGVFSSCQFIGAFAGGVFGGIGASFLTPFYFSLSGACLLFGWVLIFFYLVKYQKKRMTYTEE